MTRRWFLALLAPWASLFAGCGFVMLATHEKKKCSTCDGTGEIECSLCKGGGRTSPLFNSSQFKRRDVCEACNGTGSHKCFACNGKGKY